MIFLDVSFSVSFDGSLTTISSIAMALAEALCSIDEDSKHTEQIKQFLKQTTQTIENEEDFSLDGITELLGNSYPVRATNFEANFDQKYVIFTLKSYF